MFHKVQPNQTYIDEEVVPVAGHLVGVLCRCAWQAKRVPELLALLALFDGCDRRRCALILLQKFEMRKCCVSVGVLVSGHHFAAAPEPGALLSLNDEHAAWVEDLAHAGGASPTLGIHLLQG